MTAEGLEIVFDDLHARRRRDIDAVSAGLDPDVVHQGVEPQLICTGRDQVLANVRRSFEREDAGVERMELVAAGKRVVVGLSGPRFRGNPGMPLDGQIFIVYTVRGGRIVRMDDYLTRAEALRAADVTTPEWA